MITINQLQNQRDQLIQYTLSKIDANDWHAVQDAASDIREIDAKIRILKLVDSGDIVPLHRIDRMRMQEEGDR